MSGEPSDVIEFAAGPLNFDAWMRLLDEEVQRITGFTSGDFPDWHFVDCFEDGIEPIEAARQMLADDSLGIQFLELAGIEAGA